VSPALIAHLVQVAAEPAQPTMTTAETVLFWIVAPIIVIAASSLLWVRRAVYVAASVMLTMVGLAFLYVANSAPFLGVVQVVVYTGAIMMLFVFVLMLVGVDVADSFIEEIRGQRFAAVICGIGLAAVLGGALWAATLPDSLGIPEPGEGGNPRAVAEVLFSDYPFTLEIVGTLLIIAAVGAVVMTHRVRLRPHVGQKERSIARFKSGGIVTPFPAPGVYAGHNAVDVAAVDADGEVIETSVPEVLRMRGQVRRVDPYTQRAVALGGPKPQGLLPGERPIPSEPEGGDAA
jgi:NADH-quinone oxidoreductase subunit J